MRHTTAWVLVIVVLAVVAVWYFNARQPVEGHPSNLELPLVKALEQTEPSAIEYPVEDIVIQTEPEVEEPGTEPEPLPELEASDSVMTEVASGLLGSNVVTGWLMTEQLVNRMVATVDSLDSNKLAPLVMPVRPPAGKFLVDGEEDIFTISRINADRYEPYVAIADSLEVESALAAYARYYPLFQQAYEELGYPGAYFNDRLVAVLDHLLATPQVAAPPGLLRSEAVFIYSDEDLEALSAGQKLLLRMGEDNRRVIETKLKEIRNALTRTPPG